MSDLVRNPEDRFSYNEAHMTMAYITGSKGNYSRGRKSELSRIIEKLAFEKKMPKDKVNMM